jgi:type IV pilus assembly protein PilB
MSAQNLKSAIEAEVLKGSNLSIIQLINQLVEYAYLIRASDIHIDPFNKEVRVRMRVDGALIEVFRLPKNIESEVISRIKILCGLRTDEHQAAQDGRFRLFFGEDKKDFLDVRVSLVPTYYGENAVLRLLSDKSQGLNLEDLNFSEINQEKIKKALKKSYGMILTTGPTGSGKTTTLYTLIKLLSRPEISVVTIEDPIEYAIDSVEQIQVNARTGLTFANGLRSILRQDPNIIMVGEIRDAETAGIAINVSLTGHLLLSTLHTNDPATTLPRLLDMGIESYLVASTVNLVIGQRLVRRICEHCKISKEFTPAEIKSLSEYIPAALLKKYKTFYLGKGCEECNQTGYKGRLALHEVLEIDDSIRELILRKAPANEIRDAALKKGMVAMGLDGLIKASLGLTTIEEILRISHE